MAESVDQALWTVPKSYQDQTGPLMQLNIACLWRKILCLGVICCPLVACSPGDSSTIKISYSDWIGYDIMKLAVSKGFIPNAEIVSFAEQSEVVRAYLRGELDVVQLTTVDVLNVCSRSPQRCPVIILVLDESTGGDQVMTLSLKSLKEIKGAKVGLSTSSFGPFVLQRAMQSQALSIDDVSIVPMLIEEMPEALQSGKVQAVVLYGANAEKVLDLGGYALFDSSEIPGEILDVLAVSPSLFASRQEDVSAIVSGWYKAQFYVWDNRTDALAEMASDREISIAQFEDSLSGAYFYLNPDSQKEMLDDQGFVAENIKSIARFMESLNLLRPQSPLPTASGSFVP